MEEETITGPQAPLTAPPRSLTPPRELLAAAVALAADDCRAVLGAPAWRMTSEPIVLWALSAARFFLSEEGKATICALGLGRKGIEAGEALARAVLRRTRLTLRDIEGAPADWCAAIEVERPSFDRMPRVADACRGRQEAFPLPMAVAA